MQIDRRFFALVLLAVTGCKKAAPAIVDAGMPKEDETRPVYGSTFVAHPMATRLCGVLHALPEKRREACCGEAPGSGAVERECVRMLSQALTDKSATLEETAVSACESALTRTLDGCDWPGPAGFEVPEACVEIIGGTLAPRARCRSSLECRSGLRCVGLGPTDPGRCAPPSPQNTLCAISVDALAGATLQRLDETHPECAGTCGRRQCENALDAGTACTNNLECGVGRHCGASRGCVAGARGAAGDSCVQGACGVGLRCLEGSCRLPAPKGSACKTDQECVGGCVAGKCGPRCGVR